MKAVAPDVLVVAAYGLILPPEVLAIPRGLRAGWQPKLSALNIHASLLPRWRGAAPVARAIEAGDTETGITIMQMDAGLDTGPMLAAEKVAIAPEETTETLTRKLAKLGARLIVDALRHVDRLIATPQPEGATYAAKLSKSEAWLDWSQTAGHLERKVRAFNPFPVASSTLNGATVRIWRAHADGDRIRAPPMWASSSLPMLRACVSRAAPANCVMAELQRANGKRVAGARIRQRVTGQGRRSLRQPSRHRDGVSTVESPALAEVLRHAAVAWQSFRSGRSLDRALTAALADRPELRPAVQDALYTAVRHLAASERIVERLAARPPAPEVAALLAVSLAQLQREAYAPHTVVDQAVRAAQQSGQAPAASGFVNAVLRNFLRQRETLLAELRPTSSALQPAGVVDRTLAQRISERVDIDCRVAAADAAADTARQRHANHGGRIPRAAGGARDRSDAGRHARRLDASAAAGGRDSRLCRRRRVGAGRRRATGSALARRRSRACACSMPARRPAARQRIWPSLALPI